MAGSIPPPLFGEIKFHIKGSNKLSHLKAEEKRKLDSDLLIQAIEEHLTRTHILFGDDLQHCPRAAGEEMKS